jgi:hypothetical protein
LFVVVNTTKTKIVWAVGRPTGAANQVTLYAFNGTAAGTTLPLLWSGAAGSWPYTGGNANLVPTVMGGKVYVASYRKLAIFGLLAAGQARVRIPDEALLRAVPPEELPRGAVVWGTVREVADDRLVIQLRDERTLTVDLAAARKAGAVYVPQVGSHVTVRGALDDRGVLAATSIYRAKQPASWGRDQLR